MRSTIVLIALCAAFWFGLNDSLKTMTERDCKAGRQAACQQLLKEARS